MIWLLRETLGLIAVLSIQIKNGQAEFSPLSHCLLVDVDIFYNASQVGDFNLHQTNIVYKDSAFTKKTAEEWPSSLGSCDGVNVLFNNVTVKGKDSSGNIILGASFSYAFTDGVEGKSIEKELLRCINATHKQHDKYVKEYNWLSSIPSLNGKDGKKVKPHDARYGWNIRYCCLEKRNATCCPEGAIFVGGAEGSSCECKQGYYYDQSTPFVCHRCRRGTYQPKTNMEKCHPCPEGMTTLVEGSTSCIPVIECKREEIWTTEGTFTWETTRVRDAAKHKCPYGPDNVTVIRDCNWSSSTTASWAKFDSTMCNPSKHTKTLLTLSETPISESNVNNVTKLLEMETEVAAELDSYDIALATTTIINIVDFNSASEEVNENVIQVFDNILSVNEDVLAKSQLHNKTTSRLINVTERFADNLPLENGVAQLIAPNIEINAQAFTKRSLNKGFTYAANSKPRNSSSVIYPAITITANAFQKAKQKGSDRVISIVYKNNQLFPVLNDKQKLKKEKLDNKLETTKIGDIVLAGKFKDAAIEMVKDAVELTFPENMKNNSGVIPRCVFWDFAANGGYGNWSSKGCLYSGRNSSHVICVCNHMTNFAILLTADPNRDETDSHHRHVLSMISYIGCGVSLFAVILTLFTYVFFRDLRRSNAQTILCHLCVALIGLLVLFFVVATRDPKTTSCLVSSLLVHYFLLATFAWMGVEGVNMYLALVKVISAHVPRFMPKAVVIAWGTPMLVVIITGAVAFQDYSSDESCFLHGIAFYISAFTPAVLVLFMNFIMFALTMYSLSQMGKEVSQDNKFKGYDRVKVALAIMVLLGLTWFFGAVAIGSARLLFQYLFCIFNSLQGLAIFWFYCVRQPEVRQCWADFLRGRRGRQRRYTASTTVPALATNAVKKSSSTASPKFSSFSRRGKYNVEQNPTYLDSHQNASV